MPNNFTQGGQVFYHNMQACRSIIKRIIWYSFLCALIFMYIILKRDLNSFCIENIYTYIVATIKVRNNAGDKLLKVLPIHCKKIGITKYKMLSSREIVNNQLLKKQKAQVLNILCKNLLLSIYFYITILCGFIMFFTIRGYFFNKANYIRGAKIVSLEKLNSMIRRCNKCYEIKEQVLHKMFGRRQNRITTYRICNAIYPHNSEMLHTIITGASGTGKTILISDLVNQIRSNGDRAIIYDRMGVFIPRFYNGEEINKKLSIINNDINLTKVQKALFEKDYNSRKDVILNPLDERSPYWSIFNEVENDFDFDNIASALIPENINNVDPFWNVAARILFSSVANSLRKNHRTSNKDLIDTLLRINLKDAAALVKGTPAQSIIDEQNPKTALSVMAMISTNLKSLIHLKDSEVSTSHSNSSDKKSFSIRKWIQDDNQKGFLFISSRADRHEILKPLITTWLDIAINSLLSLEQSNNRKIWVIIDELPSLYYLPSLQTGLAESRQFGGCFVLSMQLIAQLRAIYGNEKAEATSGLCRNRIILSTPDEDTARWCSDNLGKIESEEARHSLSMGINDFHNNINVTKQIIQKNLVLPTELMQMPNLNAYIKFAGNFPVAKSEFKYVDYPIIADRYVEICENTRNGLLTKDQKLSIQDSDTVIEDDLKSSCNKNYLFD